MERYINKKSFYWLLATVFVVLVLGLLILYKIRSGPNQLIDRIRVKSSVKQKPVTVDVIEDKAIVFEEPVLQVAPEPNEPVKIELVKEPEPVKKPLTPRQRSLADLKRKGYPEKPKARQYVYEQTAEQSIPDVVEDMGNLFVTHLCRNTEGKSSAGSMENLAGSIMPNVKVLRLIEHGRDNPEEVAVLLEEAIDESLAIYEEIGYLREEERKRITFGEATPPVVIHRGGAYEETKSYSDPMYELQRLNYVINSSFYVLANIDGIQCPQLLADWIQTEKPRDYQCASMEAWFVDNYFNYTVDDSDYAYVHAEITGDYSLSGQIRKVSAWDENWDIDHHMLTMKNVDVSGLETIEVFDIPTSIPLANRELHQITGNFLNYCEENN